ncbi:MAG TPA: Smr/MutS family protein [Candidatus Polarisedimenticolia bacterium]|nr:Smr/MutS family protein [Candidatus Polarisedimenticolia bacterium]
MDEKTLTALEFDGILALLATEAVTPPGAVLASRLRPFWDPAAVRKENDLTREAGLHLERRGALPFGVLPDTATFLDRLAIEGSVLAPLEILDLLALMKAGRGLKSFLTEGRGEFPGLWEVARELPDLGNLIRYLDGKIASTGVLEDGASDDLRAVRQDLQRRAERLKELIESVTSRPEVGRALQDDFVSIRSERHVIPIRAEARAGVPGIVHGVSGSGATVFIEPIETVDLNNEIVTLHDLEAAEIQRLLDEYSGLLRGRLPELRSLTAVIGRLDLLMAKARLGRALHGRPASPATAGEIRLIGARHPLVEASLRARGGHVVPLDVEVGQETRVLVISGPNTGGKTVALKTIGLLALMHQSGLMVPAENASFPIFRGIFIDIGDRQSIPDRLSTFSARVTTIAGITAALDPPALVLLDEVGTGTDPEEGVALGIAIVDHFRVRGASVIATTHLEALKAYAALTPGCANAAMQFEEASFAPTYRMLPGIPGRSGGLEIAARLGLPEEILKEARTRRGASGQALSTYLARLQEMSIDLERRLREVVEDRRRLELERETLERDLAERGERQRRAVAAEIELALNSIRQEGERYLASLQDRELALRLRREETRVAAKLRAQARTLIRGVSGSASPTAPLRTSFAPGSAVRVEGMGLRGTVESVRGDRVVLVVRGKRVAVGIDECLPDTALGLPGARPPVLPRGVTLERRPHGEAPDELHLRGLTVEEGLAALDKYLDDACLAGVSPVRLVHGVGSGRLKRAIADLLARHPQVESFTPAPADRGGAGVTVVRLRVD